MSPSGKGILDLWQQASVLHWLIFHYISRRHPLGVGGGSWLLADGYRLVGPGSRLQVLACMFTTSGCRRRSVAVGSGAAIAAQWLPHCQLWQWNNCIFGPHTHWAKGGGTVAGLDEGWGWPKERLVSHFRHTCNSIPFRYAHIHIWHGLAPSPPITHLRVSGLPIWPCQCGQLHFKRGTDQHGVGRRMRGQRAGDWGIWMPNARRRILHVLWHALDCNFCLPLWGPAKKCSKLDE